MTTNDIKIDTSLIPDYVKDDLAAATLEFVKRTKRDPETRKLLEKEVKKLEMRRSNLKNNPKN